LTTQDQPESQDQLNPDDFFVPASDGHGHSERIWTRIQPGHFRQLGIIANSGWFPYNDKGDVIRHAIDRHIEWLEGLAPIPSVSSQVRAITSIIREEETNDEFADVFTLMAHRIGVYLSTGRPDMARSLASRIRSKIDDMPDGPWKDQYQEDFGKRFGYLLGSNEESNLMNLLKSGEE